MSPTDNKATVRRLFDEVINTGALDRADALLAPGFVEHNPTPGQQPGIAGFKQVLDMLRTAFPDLVITADEVIAEGDLVSVRLTAKGTHQGQFQGIAPTGRSAVWQGISMLRLVNGKITERWFHSDAMGLRAQLVGPDRHDGPGERPGGPPA